MIVAYRLLFASLLLAAAWVWPNAAQAQIVRCVGPDGSAIYTDRRCDEIGAMPSLPRASAPGNTTASGIASRYGCARTLQDLVYSITAAVDHRDVNQLAAVYHWVGMSADAGYRTLDQLQVIADRALLDITPIYARAERPDQPPPSTPADIETHPMPTTTAANGTIIDALPQRSTSSRDSTYPLPQRARRTPTGLRLQQTSRNGKTASQTVFGLRRHLDCWWITF